MNLPPAIRQDRLPGRLEIRRWATASQEWLRAVWRAAWRRIYPGAPSLGTLLTGALVVVFVLVAVTYVLGIGLWRWSDDVCHKAEFRCGLGIHVMGTGLVAAIAYYLVFLRREARAAAAWRKVARKSPEHLIYWLPTTAGLTGLAAGMSAGKPQSLIRSMWERLCDRLPWHSSSPLVASTVGRTDLVEEIAAELNHDAGAQIIVGSTGSGKTTVLLELTEYLARHGQLPVPITMRGTDKIDFIGQARDAYVHEAKAKDDEEADKQWNWLRQRKLITIIADDLDGSTVPMETRMASLAEASGLRLVIATRPSGLPERDLRGDRFPACIDLPELDPRRVQQTLEQRAADHAKHAGASAQVPRAKIDEIVHRGELAATPYYLALARVLADVGQLADIDTSGDVRASLLDTYRQALEDGKTMSKAALSPEVRRAVLLRLEALAYFRLGGVEREDALLAKLREIEFPRGEVELADSPIELAKRLSVLDDHGDGRLWFAHPTTLAYFAASFLTRHSDDTYWAFLDDDRVEMTPLRTLCLVLANSGKQGKRFRERAKRTIEVLHERIASDTDDDLIDRLGVCLAAAQIAEAQLVGSSQSVCLADGDWDEVVKVIADDAQTIGTFGGRRIVDKQMLIAAVARLGAYDALWQQATAKDQDYPVRREATRQLIDRQSLDAMNVVLDVIEPRVRRTIEACETEIVIHGKSEDDQGAVFDGFRAIAWVLPSLCTCAHRLGREPPHSPRDLLELARQLSSQLGLESSIAQGIKLDAIIQPGASVDELAIEMLTSAEEDYQARFWFTRVLLLQAITRRCMPSNGRDRRTAREDVRTILEERVHGRDEHPFVQETARLCLRAWRTAKWEKFIWTDMTEIAAGTTVIHPLGLDATHLIADILVALNLNGRQGPAMREHFGHVSRLPYCMSSSKNRGELLGDGERHRDCPFKLPEPSGSDTGETQPDLHETRCMCPYLYEADKSRRELSRGFCRYQRINARPLRWQPRIDTDNLREFWREMESRARF